MKQLLSGDIFANRFEIDRTAGTGGMGTVYRAKKTSRTAYPTDL